MNQIVLALILSSLGTSLPLNWDLESYQQNQELYRAQAGQYEQKKLDDDNIYTHVYQTPNGKQGYQTFIVTKDYVYSYGFGEEAEARTYIKQRGKDGIDVDFDDISIKVPKYEPPIVIDTPAILDIAPQ